MDQSFDYFQREIVLLVIFVLSDVGAGLFVCPSG